jgi:alanyl-tRNA synthetase
MKKYGLNELREMFLSFFESKGHLRLPSFSLIPQNDASLLLINSGMAPMKPWFTGEQEPPRRRVTTCQKCVRTGDIENIGKTARHGTYFEMLGNFSFGDYFKSEAIAWCWEFLTETVGIDAALLYPSIYEQDDEAFRIWHEEIGIPAERIYRFGKADNFWEHGAGPCGPCSEVYFDRGPEKGCGKPDCAVGCDCDRYIEVWNNVFTQFMSDGNGHYTELKQKNIDTGMGLERLAVVCQGVDSLFDVDTVMHITRKVTEKTGASYGRDHKTDVSLRVITDHIRSATMMIGDGVLPSNEGRGYVLRRLLRRAARHGRLLGVTGTFLSEVCATVIDVNKDAYPDLDEKQGYITQIIKTEEDNFAKTIDAGMSILTGLLTERRKQGETVFPGADAFKLYDTYGFPVDLTAEIIEENNMTLDKTASTSSWPSSASAPGLRARRWATWRGPASTSGSTTRRRNSSATICRGKNARCSPSSPTARCAQPSGPATTPSSYWTKRRLRRDGRAVGRLGHDVHARGVLQGHERPEKQGRQAPAPRCRRRRHNHGGRRGDGHYRRGPARRHRARALGHAPDA